MTVAGVDDQQRCTPVVLTRRAALSLAGGLSLGPFVIGSSWAAEAAVAEHDIRYVVTDRRYRQSLAFGTIFANRGVPRLEVTDGLTRMWSQTLAPLWQGRSGAVAGLTRTDTWAGLAEQARSAGRKSILVGRHVLFQGQEGASHSVGSAHAISGVLSALEGCGEAWPEAMGDFVASYRTSSRRAAHVFSQTAMPARTDVSLTLTSWIIA